MIKDLERHYLCGSKVITKVFIRGSEVVQREGDVMMIRVRKKFEDAPLMEEGTMSQGMQAETLQAEKGKEMEPFLNPQREQDFTESLI